MLSVPAQAQPGALLPFPANCDLLHIRSLLGSLFDCGSLIKAFHFRHLRALKLSEDAILDRESLTPHLGNKTQTLGEPLPSWQVSLRPLVVVAGDLKAR